MEQQFDFSGWATRANMRCADGRTILRDAFKINDGQKVPLVFDHIHDQLDAVIGHAVLKNMDEGVYAYCSFNETENGKLAKALVEHGDISSLSIFANQLKQNGKDVVHGNIREVSIVLAGANPGAFIQDVVKHSDNGTDEVDPEQGVIFTDETIEIAHADGTKETANKTPDEIFDTLTEEQKTVVFGLLADALEQVEKTNQTEEPKKKEEETDMPMKHNVFDKGQEGAEGTPEATLSHSAMKEIMDDVKRYGSLRDSCLAHGVDQIPYIAHGIDDIDYLFPDAKTVTATPEFIKRKTGWVAKVIDGVHHTPFSRIKSVFADITGDEARARGYVKGKIKLDEVFGLLKRTTTPTTVYKKQKLDRDDVVDIVDFDSVAWLKSEMRMMLDEELARAYLIGDGRSSASDDKINEQNIRPIWTDDELFTINKTVSVAANATKSDKADACITGVIEAYEDYEGAGEPTFYVRPDMLTNMRLLKDTTGRIIYKTLDELATALEVKEIVVVPAMKDKTRVVNGETRTLVGIIVNLDDYNVGADKGGAVNMFDDFDIDYNQQKYLIETRCSGALVKPKSAIAVELKTA